MIRWIVFAASIPHDYLPERELKSAGILYVCIAYNEYMTEVTVSARIPKELEKEVERLMEEEHLEKSAALRKLLHIGVENYRLGRALEGLRVGRFSLSRAAEEAGVSIWEILEEAARRRVAWVADDVLEDMVGRRRR